MDDEMDKAKKRLGDFLYPPVVCGVVVEVVSSQQGGIWAMTRCIVHVLFRVGGKPNKAVWG